MPDHDDDFRGVDLDLYEEEQRQREEAYARYLYECDPLGGPDYMPPDDVAGPKGE